jgi:hypothetical protein
MLYKPTRKLHSCLIHIMMKVVDGDVIRLGNPTHNLFGEPCTMNPRLMRKCRILAPESDYPCINQPVNEMPVCKPGGWSVSRRWSYVQNRVDVGAAPRVIRGPLSFLHPACTLDLSEGPMEHLSGSQRMTGDHPQWLVMTGNDYRVLWCLILDHSDPIQLRC